VGSSGIGIASLVGATGYCGFDPEVCANDGEQLDVRQQRVSAVQHAGGDGVDPLTAAARAPRDLGSIDDPGASPPLRPRSP